MELLIFVIAAAALGASAVRWGCDSRAAIGDDHVRHYGGDRGRTRRNGSVRDAGPTGPRRGRGRRVSAIPRSA